MSLNNRRVVTNIRTVNYNPSGLNERFANLEKNKSSNTTTIVAQRPQIQQQQQQQKQKSVFSRIKATQPMNKNKSIQQRLGKIVHERKKGKMAGQVTKPSTNKKVLTRKPDQKKNGGKDLKKNIKKKAMSADDLDKSLDAYMMKDPKTAQAKLDAELTSYMSSAPTQEEAL